MKELKDYVDHLNILYEDNHIIVCEKFVNVLSQKDITEDIDMTTIIKEYLKIKYNKPGNVYLGLVHRLDRRVGGVMVFAKTSKAASRLSSAFQSHDVIKKYLCICKGVPEKSGNIALLISKDEKENIAYVSKNGKEAKLSYELLASDGVSSLVSVNLLTGRYNQIRLSFAHIGYPILNDYKYDKKAIVTKDDLALWCYRLEFIHPVIKEKMIFTLPPSRKVWDRYKEYLERVK